MQYILLRGSLLSTGVFILLFVVIACVIGCGIEQNDESLLEIVPGTESVSASPGAMYVSPDERWVTFFERDSTMVVNGLASIEIGSGRRVEHSLDRISVRDPERPNRTSYGLLEAGYGLGIGWHEGNLYIPDPDRGAKEVLLVTNDHPFIGTATLPHDRLYLSDGPEPGVWLREAKNRLRGRKGVNIRQPQTMYSAAWLDDRYRETTYTYDDETREIVALVPGANRRVITRVSGGGLFYDRSFRWLRVSPGETYLAYFTNLKHRFIPMPPGRGILRVVDLDSGETREVCRFRIVGSMLWSADGTKLYLAVNDSFAEDGIYIVDIDKAFQRGTD